MTSGDFESALIAANRGDFVYLDPPYDPVSDTSSYTGYTENGFGKNEQIRLKFICDELTQKGVRFLLSNSATAFIRETYSLYIQKYGLHLVRARRNINSNAMGRGEIDEILIRNYHL
jgi:DNA adenine methylase